MAAISPPVCDFGWKAAGFELSDTEGKYWTLESLRGPSGLLVMFICNHCPYVMSVIDRLCRDMKDVQALGFGVAAIIEQIIHQGRCAAAEPRHRPRPANGARPCRARCPDRFGRCG